MIEPIKPEAKNYTKEEAAYVFYHNEDIPSSIIEHIYDLSINSFNIKTESDGEEIYIIAYTCDNESYNIALKQYEKDLELYKEYLIKLEKSKKEDLYTKEILEKSKRYEQYLKLMYEFEGDQ